MGRPRSVAAPTDGRLHFVRYPNRRFYSFDARLYVSAWEIVEAASRDRIAVYDSATGADITKWTLALAKHLEEKARLATWAERMGIKWNSP